MAQETKARDEGQRPADAASSASVPDDQALTKAEGDRLEDSTDEGASLEDGDTEQAAAQLGVDRYVLAGFFAAGLLAAYVLGRAIHSLWSTVANKDWFTQTLPLVAAVPDEDKSMYATIVGGLVSLVVVYRTYRRPDVRLWSSDVASELAKVVWPSRKEVTSSTFIVIVASTVATVYLTLLDRLWAFITNIVYGDAS